MNAISKRLLSWLCVIAMVLSFAPAIDLSGFAVETKAASALDSVDAAIIEQMNFGNNLDDSDAAFEVHLANNTCPVCGELTEANKWTKKTSTSGNLPDVEGQSYHYYYDDAVTEGPGNMIGLYANSGKVNQNNTVCLWLKSTTNIVNNGTRFVMLGGTDNTVNIFGQGSITTNVGTGTDYGMFQLGSGVLNLYGGTFILENAGTRSTYAALRANGADVNIYDGVVIGPAEAPVSDLCYNVSINSASSVVNMFGGTIRNGVSDVTGLSGNVSIGSNGTFNMYGGTITGGQYKAGEGIESPAMDGGNVLVGALNEKLASYGAGKFNMYGGTISNGKASRSGGNIAVPANKNGNTAVTGSTCHIYGGNVEDGIAAISGGNLYASYEASVGEYATLDGGKCYGTGGSDGGANIFYNYKSKDLVVKGKVLNGEAVNFGGNIGIAGGARLILDGATVANGKCTSTTLGSSWGGNIRAYNSNVQITNNSLVYGGTCAKDGNGTNAFNIGVLGDKTNNPELIISDSIVVGGILYNRGSSYTESEQTKYYKGTKVVLSGATKIVPFYEVPGEGKVTAQGGRAITAQAYNADAGQIFDVSGLTEGAEIWMTGSKGTTFAENVTNAQELVKYFKCTATSTLAVLATEDSLYIGDKPEEKPVKPEATVGGQNITDEVWETMLDAAEIQKAALALDPETATTCPACGATGIKWEEAKNPGSRGVRAMSRHYYLDADTTVSTNYNWYAIAQEKFDAEGNATTSNVPVNGATICLLLKNGNTAKEIGGVMGIRGGTSNCTFNIMGEGIITSNGAKVTDTVLGTITVQGTNNTVNLYGGTIIYTKDPVKDGAPGAAAIDMRGYSNTVNMYEDVVIGPAEQDLTNATYNVRVTVEQKSSVSTFNMYGGTIRNGVTDHNKYSGNVYLHYNSKYSSTKPTFNMYGGVIENGSYKQGEGITSVSNAGGNIYAGAGSQLNIFGGTIRNGVAKANGGNIYAIDSGVSKITIKGGTITGGQANYGGNFYCYTVSTIGEYALVENGEATTMGGNIYYFASALRKNDISGGEIKGGTAPSGANIAVLGSKSSKAGSQLTISGNAKIYGGEAAKNGGNVYVADYGKVIQTGGKIYNGISNGTGGGNVFVNVNCTYDMQGGEIYGGQTLSTGANANAGNVLVQGTSTNDTENKVTVPTHAYFNMSGDAKIYNGTANNQAGNIRVYLGELTMTDNAQVYGGNAIGASTDNVWLVDANLIMDGNAKITATAGYGAAVQGSPYRIGSNITLKGNASLVSETGAECIGQTTNGKHAELTDDEGNKLPLTSTFNIADGWTGTAYINVGGATQKAGQDMEVEYIRCGTETAPGTFTGKLYVGANKIGALVHPVAGEKAGVLYLASAAVVDAEGVATWSASNEEALAAYDIADGGYLILNGEAEIDEDIKVELKGADLKLTGSGKVYGIDSSNDDYSGYGKLTVEGGVQVQKEAFNGEKRYLALKEADGKWGFHRIEMVLTHVTLRTSEAGLYYKSMIKSDDVLASRCLGYGVVLSLNNMPGDDFLTETGDINEFTMIEGPYTTDTEHKVTLNSGSVFNIIKATTDDAEKATNAQRAQLNVFANLYVAIDQDGAGDLNAANYFLGDKENQGASDKGVFYSLMSVLEAINENWNLYNDTQKALIKSTVLTWAEWVTPEAQANWAGLLNNILA